ncbi:extracellular solute-binding protein [Nocardioides sp. cx-173]|uniref:extracellular solute-binding protein n=1 Tax=Nocardioides sp. cx-173 TaxID=2898796 RepID=UPI001E4E54E7|nr:extracellular solute-binding protein [Nocardioides sp. cx-173]MCD4523867.1 extracellular solute-binding protein [Nocardioides sp. cx-173]UGB41813.1 extracellular solute-binding protein [Nocardioides sp. cx-173]
MRRTHQLVPLAAAALLLTACATGSSDDESDDASYDREAELSGALTVMGFGAVDEIASTRLDRAEEALGGDVDVELVEGDLDIQQFLSSVASGEPPEIIYADRKQIGTFASRGAIVPLTDCIDGEQVDTSVLRESALDQVTFADEIWAVPEFNLVQIVQANGDLLRQEGLTLDDVNGSDWDAVAEANRALMGRQGGDLSVIGYDTKLPEFLPLWAKANGADLISEDGRTAQLDDPAVVEALEFAVSVYDEQGGFSDVKAFRDSADFFGEGNQFASGTLGAMPMEQWYVSVLNDVSPQAPVVFDTFRDTDGEPLAFASGSAWAIPKGSANPEAACRFARVMTETESWVAAAQERVRLRGEKEGGIFTGLLTANEEADEQVRAMVEPSGEEKWDSAVTAQYDANDHTFSLPANPAGEEFETAWEDAVNRVLNGQQSPQEAMAQAQEEAQSALDAGWAEWEER